jgi:predicted alpha/beta superfamily hydrolase
MFGAREERSAHGDRAKPSRTAPPVTLPRSWAFPLAGSDGRERSIMVAAPTTPAPAGGYPAIYLLDGHALFGMAHDLANLFAVRAEVSGIDNGLVVAIGYPSGETFDGPARTLDFTAPSLVPSTPMRPDGRPWPPTGGADSFIDFLTRDLVPLIEGEWQASRERRTLFGHSLGGLLVVHAVLTSPASFRSFVAASPSLWFGQEQPAPPPTLAAELAALPPRDLILLAGSLEEPAGPAAADPVRAERQRRNRILGNARDLIERLAASAPALRASLHALPDENHASMLPTALSRGVRLAFAST